MTTSPAARAAPWSSGSTGIDRPTRYSPSRSPVPSREASRRSSPEPERTAPGSMSSWMAPSSARAASTPGTGPVPPFSVKGRTACRASSGISPAIPVAQRRASRSPSPARPLRSPPNRSVRSRASSSLPRPTRPRRSPSPLPLPHRRPPKLPPWFLPSRSSLRRWAASRGFLRSTPGALRPSTAAPSPPSNRQPPAAHGYGASAWGSSSCY